MKFKLNSLVVSILLVIIITVIVATTCLDFLALLDNFSEVAGKLLAEWCLYQ